MQSRISGATALIKSILEFFENNLNLFVKFRNLSPISKWLIAGASSAILFVYFEQLALDNLKTKYEKYVATIVSPKVIVEIENNIVTETGEITLKLSSPWWPQKFDIASEDQALQQFMLCVAGVSSGLVVGIPDSIPPTASPYVKINSRWQSVLQIAAVDLPAAFPFFEDGATAVVKIPVRIQTEREKDGTLRMGEPFRISLYTSDDSFSLLSIPSRQSLPCDVP